MMNLKNRKRKGLVSEKETPRNVVRRLERFIAQQEKTIEGLEKSEKKYRSFFDNALVAMLQSRIEDGKLLDANEQFAVMFGYGSRDELLAESLPSNRYVDLKDRKKLLAMLYDKGEVKDFEARLRRKDGTIRWGRIWARIVPDKGYIEAISTDVTERKMVEKALEKKEKELQVQARKLEEMNSALKVLISHLEHESKQKEDNMSAVFKTLIFPYFDRLKSSRMEENQKAFIEIIETNLRKIFSSFAVTLSSGKTMLSPTEIQVAALVKEGKTSKEIAGILNVSPDTVSFHRKNMRKKFKLVKHKANLRTYLQTLETR
jgi:PAS domain S-box-containing protein